MGSTYRRYDNFGSLCCVQDGSSTSPQDRRDSKHVSFSFGHIFFYLPLFGYSKLWEYLSLDPIWTVKTGSLFLLSVESRELFINDGLAFVVKDYDSIGSDEPLGFATVHPSVLYQAKGERMEFKLQAPPGTKRKKAKGYLAIRCRRATDYDKKFMAEHTETKKAVNAVSHPVTMNSNLRSIVLRNSKVEKDGTKKVRTARSDYISESFLVNEKSLMAPSLLLTQYKMRPKPDPHRVEETEWMSKDAIEKEVMKPSEQWVDAGSGNLGRIFLEVLRCDDLPNLDTGGFLGNKTDAFVSVVYEDVYARTETIDDCLSPRWMPWTNRAFILNMQHSSSQIFIGVFDYDAGPIDDHDLIGRVTIDITNLRRNTEYILSYNIYPSARIRTTERKIKGQVTVRLRLEIPDERKLLLCALEPPVNVYVNVKKKKDFRVVRQTCLGKYDTEKYSLNTFKS